MESTTVASKPKVTQQHYQGTRVLVESYLPYEKILEKLYGSVGRPENPPWPRVISPVLNTDIETFTAAALTVVGPHEFMIFNEYKHDLWAPPIFGVGVGRRFRRVFIGNPLLGITVLRHDLTTGLAAPVELFFLEAEDKKSTSIYYQLPSALMAGINRDPKLVEAALNLDEKLANIVMYIASD